MKDHIQWRPNWLISEYELVERYYDREERRHALAAFLGALTALASFAGLVYMVS